MIKEKQEVSKKNNLKYEGRIEMKKMAEAELEHDKLMKVLKKTDGRKEFMANFQDQREEEKEIKMFKKNQDQAKFSQNKELLKAEEEMKHMKLMEKVENTVAKIENRKTNEFLKRIEKEEMRRLKAISMSVDIVTLPIPSQLL